MFTKLKVETVKRTAACLAVVLGLSATIAIPAGAQDRVRVSIQNASRYDIYEIHMSRSSDRNWERDLPGNSVLASGGSFTLTAPEGTYDLKLVDEDGDTCTVKGLGVFDNKSWTITDSWLLGCEFH